MLRDQLGSLSRIVDLRLHYLQNQYDHTVYATRRDTRSDDGCAFNRDGDTEIPSFVNMVTTEVSLIYPNRMRSL